ncbi:MAG TPA: response regulator transcription factor [Actinomycetota bacterium]|nr:response regulator transcription factor [Actinomycetota bacterium]
MGDERIRVVLADEQALFREAVRVVLASEGDLDVVGEARDGHEALSEVERLRPDVAIVDAGLPNCDGIRTTALIQERVPECRVVVVSDEEDVRALVAALEAGARGFLTKEHALSDLIQATRMVHRGETFVPPPMMGSLIARLLRRRREQDEAYRRLARLTRREREVLALLAQGGDNHVIAQRLVISPQTARTHIQNVLAKLGVHSRLEAAAFVTRNGIQHELVEAEGVVVVPDLSAGSRAL